jgi:hypothetical protein
MTRHSPARRRVVALAALFVIAAACGDDDNAGNAERFCGEVEFHQATLTNPDLVYDDDIEPLLQLYREIGALAPLSIEEEWNQLIVNYETASTVVPGDEESEQRAIATALQSEKAAAAVNRWLIDNCALDIGPVDTLVPQG